MLDGSIGEISGKWKDDKEVKNTMKAQVMHEWNGPFHLEDRPIPKVGPTEVLIEVKACGAWPSEASRSKYLPP